MKTGPSFYGQSLGKVSAYKSCNREKRESRLHPHDLVEILQSFYNLVRRTAAAYLQRGLEVVVFQTGAAGVNLHAKRLDFLQHAGNLIIYGSQFDARIQKKERMRQLLVHPHVCRKNLSSIFCPTLRPCPDCQYR